MSGARRHCPAAVTDTERDMSRELNTARGEQGHGSEGWRERQAVRAGICVNQRDNCLGANGLHSFTAIEQ